MQLRVSRPRANEERGDWCFRTGAKPRRASGEPAGHGENLLEFCWSLSESARAHRITRRYGGVRQSPGEAIGFRLRDSYRGRAQGVREYVPAHSNGSWNLFQTHGAGAVASMGYEGPGAKGGCVLIGNINAAVSTFVPDVCLCYKRFRYSAVCVKKPAAQGDRKYVRTPVLAFCTPIPPGRFDGCAECCQPTSSAAIAIRKFTSIRAAHEIQSHELIRRNSRNPCGRYSSRCILGPSLYHHDGSCWVLSVPSRV